MPQATTTITTITFISTMTFMIPSPSPSPPGKARGPGHFLEGLPTLQGPAGSPAPLPACLLGP